MSVKIHGKEYLTVAERVKMFHKENQNGSISTKLVKLEEGICVIKAIITPDVKNADRIFTGFAMEEMAAHGINKTSYVEVCDTSAIGRGLAAAGYAGSEYASADEVQNAIHQQNVGVVTDEQKERYQEYLKHKIFDRKRNETNKWWATLRSEKAAEAGLVHMLKRINEDNEKKAKKAGK